MNPVKPAKHDAVVSVVRQGPDWIADAVTRLDRLDGLWLVSRGFAPADRDRLRSWLDQPAPEPARTWQQVESYDAVLESMHKLAQRGGDGLAVMRVSLFLRATVHTDHVWSAGTAASGAAVACLLCSGPRELEAVRRQADLLGVGIMEVASPQAMIDRLEDAFTLSRSRGRVTVVAMAESLWRRGGSLRLAPVNQKAKPQTPLPLQGEWPAQTGAVKTPTGQRALDDLHAAHTDLTFRPNRDEPTPLAIVTAASHRPCVLQALDLLGITRDVPVLTVGVLSPWRSTGIERLRGRCQRVLVADAADGWFAMKVAHDVAQWPAASGQPVPVHGVVSPAAGQGEPQAAPPVGVQDMAAQIVRTLRGLQLHGTASARLITPQLEAYESSLAAQPLQPGMLRDAANALNHPRACTGCDTCAVASELRRLIQRLADPHYMLNRHSRKPMRLILAAHSGCPSVLALDGVQAASPDADRQERQADIFSVGQVRRGRHTRIADAAAARRDHLFVLLDGHQPSLRSARSKYRRELDRFLLASLPSKRRRKVDVIHADPSDRARFARLLERAALRGGVQVVVVAAADLAERRRADRDAELEAIELKGFLPRQTRINADPQLMGSADQHAAGRRRVADISDTGVIQEQATIHREQAPKLPTELDTVYRLPDPARPIHARQPVWSCQIVANVQFGARTLGQLLCEAGHAMGYRIVLRSYPEPGGRAMNSQVVFDRPGEDDAPLDRVQPIEVRPRDCDLILGIDGTADSMAAPLTEVAHASKTAAVVDAASGSAGAHPSELIATLKDHCHGDRIDVMDAQAVSLRAFGSSRYVNLILLGMTLQRGYLPLTVSALDRAVGQVFFRDRERNRLALRIGRAMVVEPEKVRSWLSDAEPCEPAALLQRVSRTIALRTTTHGGKLRSRRFRIVVRRAMRGPIWRSVPDDLRCDLIRCADDVMLVGGLEQLRTYVGLVGGVVQQEQHAVDQQFALLREAIWGLARAICVMDDAAVAARLTDPAKLARDRHRLGIAPGRGDRVTYRYPMASELNLFGQTLRMEWTGRPGVLRWLAAAGPWLRRIKGWYARETAYRDWYIELVKRCSIRSAWDYQRWCEALATVQDVTGHREVRVASMNQAMRRAEAILAIDAPLSETASEASAGKSAAGNPSASPARDKAGVNTPSATRPRTPASPT